MFNELLELIISQGIWTFLSFILIYYIFNTQEKRDLKQDNREIKYQEIISELSKRFDLIHLDIQEIKKTLQNLKK